jgi:hypothetical protein
MAALLPTSRYIVALGPIKMEIVEFTGTVTLEGGGSTQTGVTSADTYKSLLQNPKFALGVANTVAEDSFDVSISGKTLTMTNTGLTSGDARILTFGF